MSMFAKGAKNLLKGNPRVRKRPTVDIKVSDFGGGTNVLFSETRLKPNEAKESTNLMLVEDGAWKKRWGTKAYGGVSFTNTPDGFTEYKKSDGSRELIVVADGKAYVVDPTGETKTEISGATFTQGDRCDFVQINDFLYIVNGTDNMARYNGTTLSTYSSISTPVWAGTPLARGSGLSAGSYTYYYRVSAVNEVGETLAAAEQSLTVDVERNSWDSSSNEYIDIDWDAVSGATGYIVYMSDISGYETKLAETTTHSYRDDGTAVLNPYIEPPTESTAQGPKVRSIAIIGNRIWATGDPSNLQRVYWSGTGANLGNFAPSFDGGWVDLETGSRNQAVKVIDFNRECHVICKTDDGRGSIWEVDLGTTTVAGTEIVIPVPTKLIAQMGSNARRSVVHVENDVYFLNPAGVFTLGYEPNVFNVLRTKEQSVKIRPYIRDAYEPDLSESCAYYYDAKVFFSIPTSEGEPNRIFYYDTEKNAWVKDWTVGVSQFGEFTEADGTTKLIGIQGAKLIEFSENYEDDLGTAFEWKYISPRFSVSKDWSQFAFIEKAYVRMRATRGTPSFSFNGTNMEGNSPTLGSDTIEQGVSDTGMGWDLMGSQQMGATSGAPTFFAQENLTRYLPIDRLLRDVQWQISGSGTTDTAVITGIMAEGYIVETDAPSAWLLT